MRNPQDRYRPPTVESLAEELAELGVKTRRGCTDLFGVYLVLLNERGQCIDTIWPPSTAFPMWSWGPNWEYQLATDDVHELATRVAATL